MNTKYHIIGDPIIRERIAETCRIAWKSVVYAFAVIGVLATLGTVLWVLSA